ncbi:hypothetical protein CIB95_11895 [Lottiidibacillus patelloidae]|uniref:SGNH hydrolase-type esterase domain-containing protein n=1 Tax=Lottiidibacillus patelloidae TaxID=2670334 RepID=A0A263BRX6_9BACI|nr:SGNH/GDSL hydrolase family protein [Lottiidibacillus patelloidae]OZM56471.1 hypothetical protein CIB95_11895 [Lottiidibacillus patelloidae]
MKNIIAIVFAALGLLIIVIGHFHYENKLSEINERATKAIEMSNEENEKDDSDKDTVDNTPSSDDDTESTNKEEEDSSNKTAENDGDDSTEDDGSTGEGENESRLTDEQIAWMVANLPEQLQKKVIKKLFYSETIKIVAMGSESTSPEDTGWPALLGEELISAYGENTFEVTVASFGKKNSMEVVNEAMYEVVYDLNPDIIIFEPFMFRDNGTVRVEHTLENLTTIINDITTELPDVSFLIQPSHPIYNAYWYPKEIEALQAYAEEMNYTYLNHWTAWPDHQTREIFPYLNEDGSAPSEKGHETWAAFLNEYFIASE